MFCFFALSSCSSVYNMIMDKQDNIPYFIMVTTKSCPNCVTAKPEFDGSKEYLGKYVRFLQVDADEDKELSSKLHVTHVPFFAYCFKGQIMQFPGPPQKDKLVNFVASKLPKDVEKITRKPDDLQNGVIIFSKRFTPPSIISVASYALAKEGLKFYFTNTQAVYRQFHVPEYPAIYFIKNGETKLYDGPEDIATFVENIKKHFESNSSERPSNEL